MTDFTNIAYLQKGNIKQQKAYGTLIDLDIFEKLKEFSPVLTGTIPIDIDIDGSDLDIVCFCKDLKLFQEKVTKYYQNFNGFVLQQKLIRNHNTIVVRFYHNDFLIELFGQNRPIEEQEAYRHMLIEHKVLIEKGECFRQQVIELKKLGYKTEPAFAKLLGLKGNPYDELLKI